MVDGVDQNQVIVSYNFRTGNSKIVNVTCLHLKAKEQYAAVREGQGLAVLDRLSRSIQDCHAMIVSSLILYELG